jgi:hypothetical protein
MKALNKFVNDYNNFDVKFFKAKPLDLSNAMDRKRIAEMIDCKLSPENLSCDGELSRTEITRRYNHLTSAARDLLTLDPTIKFYEYA